MKPCRIEPFYGTLTNSKLCRLPPEKFKKIFPGGMAYNTAKIKYIFDIVSAQDIAQLSDEELEMDIEKVLQTGVYFNRSGNTIRYNTLARNLTTLVEEQHKRSSLD